MLYLQVMKRRIALLSALLLPLVVSCNAISSFVHDDEVVARVGKERLYLSTLRGVIPSDASPEDSAVLAAGYINAWASDLLYLKLADEQLSKAEKDVRDELEDYRRSLLKYRYEQSYVEERLDTLITEDQIRQYYESHKDQFVLTSPVLKVRFLDIMADSPNKDLIIKKMSSDDYDDTVEADSLAYSSALRYFDNSDTWMDAAALAREFGTDAATMLSWMKDSFISVERDSRLRVAYVLDICRSGQQPIEYSTARIRDIILSSRKRALLSGLEQDLLKDALERKQFVICQ